MLKFFWLGLLILLTVCTNEVQSLQTQKSDSPPKPISIQTISEKSFGFELVAVTLIGFLILRKNNV